MPLFSAIRSWITRHQLRLARWENPFVDGRRLRAQQRLLLRAIGCGIPLEGVAWPAGRDASSCSLARWLVKTDHTRHPRIARAAIAQLIRDNDTCTREEAITILLHFLYTNPDFEACQKLFSHDGFWMEGPRGSGRHDTDRFSGYLYHARLSRIPEYLVLFSSRFEGWTPHCLATLSRSLDAHLAAINHLPTPVLQHLADGISAWLDTALPAPCVLDHVREIRGILFDALPATPTLAQRKVFEPIAARVYPMIEKLERDTRFQGQMNPENHPGMVEVTTELFERSPWASGWQTRDRNRDFVAAGILFGAHPFWSQCHPDALLGDRMRVTLPAGLPVKKAGRL
jgi:hypothetical protein